jgi:hypothetical protein
LDGLAPKPGIQKTFTILGGTFERWMHVYLVNPKDMSTVDRQLRRIVDLVERNVRP